MSNRNRVQNGAGGQMVVNQNVSHKDATNSITNANHGLNGAVKCTTTKEWKVKASSGAINTSNPIREIIETMNLTENPNKKVIPLSIGDPTIFGNLKPCKEILDAIRKAEMSGKFYGYQTAAGLESARKAVANYHMKCTGNKVNPQDVILASGCSHAIDLCICVLAHHGQNILIPRPGFPLYKTLTSVYGVAFKQYNLLADKNWSVDLKHLESLIDDNTAAIVVNNPSNPCGSVFTREHLLEILELAERHHLPIIADEIYDKFVFAPKHHVGRGRTNTSSPSSRSMDYGYDEDEFAEAPDETCPNHDLKSHHHNNHHHHQRTTAASKQRVNDENRKPSRRLSSLGDRAGRNEQQRQVPTILAMDQYQNRHDDEDEQEDDDTSEFQHVPFISMAELSETVPILTCGGISKTCLIPGVRLGWIIINDRQNIFDQSVRQGLGRLTQRLMGPNSLIQGALHDILNNVPEQFYKQTMDFIFENAKKCYQRLKSIRGLKPFMPRGSMYLMVRFDPHIYPTIDGDLDFTSRLMNEESVLVLPGSCFDLQNFFRICLTVPTNIMEEALNRIEEFCERRSIEAKTVDAEIGDRKAANIVVDQLQIQLPLKQRVNTPKTKQHLPLIHSTEQQFIDQRVTLTLKSPFEWAPSSNIGSQKT